MIIHLPEIYPDELVYSWFCRYYVHGGFISHKSAMQELYCKKSDNPSKEFIGNLNPAAREQIAKMYSMEELLFKHTMFPQYARFVSLSQKKKAVNRLSCSSCDVHTLFPVLPRMKEEQYLKYCPLCAKEDREQYKEVYWHCRHQIRNMSICTKHRCRLISSTVTFKSERAYIFEPAEFTIQDDTVVYEDNPLLIQFAEYIEKIFDSPMDFERDVPISAVLYHSMNKTKYMKSTGRCRNTALFAEDIRAYYEKIGLCNVVAFHQIQRILLHNGYNFSFVCQIAFFLGMTVEELILPELSEEQIEEEKNTHYMRGAEQIDWKRFDEDTAPILEQLARDIYDGTASEIGRPERVSKRLICKKLELSIYGQQNMPKCNDILERYRETYSESWARKIVWAYKKLETEKEKIYWSDIRRLSGVKKADIDEVVPYFGKHTDKATTDKIVAVIYGEEDDL